MTNPVNVSEIIIFEYISAFSDFRTGLSDYYIKTRNCLILGAYDCENNPVGLLIVEAGTNVEILFLKVLNNEVNYKKSLLRYLIDSIDDNDMITWRLSKDDADIELAKSIGFKCNNTLIRFQTVGADSPSATEVINDYEKLYGKIKKCGFETKCFDSLSGDELNQIVSDPYNEFDSYLHPEKLINDDAGFCGRHSFAAIKDGKVVGYTVVRMPSANKYIFEIICIAKSMRKKGIFVLPLLDTIKALKETNCQKVFFAIYENNAGMLPVIRKHFGKLISSESIQENYSFSS